MPDNDADYILDQPDYYYALTPMLAIGELAR